MNGNGYVVSRWLHEILFPWDFIKLLFKFTKKKHETELNSNKKGYQLASAIFCCCSWIDDITMLLYPFIYLSWMIIEWRTQVYKWERREDEGGGHVFSVQYQKRYDWAAVAFMHRGKKKDEEKMNRWELTFPPCPGTPSRIVK